MFFFPNRWKYSLLCEEAIYYGRIVYNRKVLTILCHMITLGDSHKLLSIKSLCILSIFGELNRLWVKTNLSGKWVKIIFFLVLKNWKCNLSSSNETEPDVTFQSRKQSDMNTLVTESGGWARFKALLLYYIRDAVKKKNDVKLWEVNWTLLEKKVFGKLSMLSRIPEVYLRKVLGRILLDRIQGFLRQQRI